MTFRSAVTIILATTLNLMAQIPVTSCRAGLVVVVVIVIVVGGLTQLTFRTTIPLNMDHRGTTRTGIVRLFVLEFGYLDRHKEVKTSSGLKRKLSSHLSYSLNHFLTFPPTTIATHLSPKCPNINFLEITPVEQLLS